MYIEQYHFDSADKLVLGQVNSAAAVNEQVKIDRFKVLSFVEFFPKRGVVGHMVGLEVDVL